MCTLCRCVCCVDVGEAGVYVCTCVRVCVAQVGVYYVAECFVCACLSLIIKCVCIYALTGVVCLNAYVSVCSVCMSLNIFIYYNSKYDRQLMS